jgi:hypothetical protein
MKKNNNFIAANVSFEDFEQAMMAPGADSTPLDELVKERLAQEKESRKKDKELKKAKRSKKQ